MQNGLFFQWSSLKTLGLHVQLGHPPGRFCPTKEAGHQNFMVINVNGIHSAAVDFCHCIHVPHRAQLLQIGGGQQLHLNHKHVLPCWFYDTSIYSTSKAKLPAIVFIAHRSTRPTIQVSIPHPWVLGPGLSYFRPLTHMPIRIISKFSC